jgi:hypothetical protein
VTTQLPELLSKARAAIGDHDPTRASSGRCNCLACRCDRLAARGWPASVVGDGSGVRSTGVSSSTEHAAGVVDPFAALNDRAGVLLPRLRTDLLALLAIAAIVDSHGSDDDVVPPGTGECACGCGRRCDPRRNPANRLRAGLAPACYQRWRRWRAEYPGVTISDYLDACARERGETRARPVAPAAEQQAG